jgi:DNA invertase Pin-like site-specific DNA recombinase
LISQRTKEALARKKAEGIILGRPLGRKSTHYKLTGQEGAIIQLLEEGRSKSSIARALQVNRSTLESFLKNKISIEG